MAAPTAWTFPTGARTRILNGTWDFDTDTFKIALFGSGSNLGSGTTTYAGVTSEVGNGNGYATGGAAVTLSLAGTNPVTVDTSSNATWTASGAGFAARYAALYEVGGDVVCYCTLDSTPADVSVAAGNTLTIDPPAAGVFQLA